MGIRVYIETSVMSYLVARASRNVLAAAWQQVTQQWWDNRRSRFDLFTSQLVMAEAGQGYPDAAQRRCEQLKGIPDLEVTDDVVALAKKLVGEGALPREAMDDAMHVAVAAVHGVDYLLTWNCRHIANAELSPALRRIVKEFGLDLPVLCTPEELMGGGS